MYAKNVVTFLMTLVKDGEVNLDTEDEIIRETLLTRDGEVVHSKVRESLGLDEKAEPEPPSAASGEPPPSPSSEGSPAPAPSDQDSVTTAPGASGTETTQLTVADVGEAGKGTPGGA
jgi:hypothetical protein